MKLLRKKGPELYAIIGNGKEEEEDDDNDDGGVYLYNFHNGASDGGGGPFVVMATSDDTIEELSSLAKLHDKVDCVVILVQALERDDIRVRRQLVHDNSLPPDIFNVHSCPKLALGDGFASEDLLGRAIRAEVSDSEFTAPQFFPQHVFLKDVVLHLDG